MKLSNWAKFFIILFCFVASVVGFLIKLPSAFRNIDRELHLLFYFLAAAALNILFSNQKIIWHVFIGFILFIFGLSIEYAQELSNKLLHVKIHGRFDPEDVKYNLLGLLVFSALWFVYMVFRFIKKTWQEKTT
jgi:hypothetical protein